MRWVLGERYRGHCFFVRLTDFCLINAGRITGISLFRHVLTSHICFDLTPDQEPKKPAPKPPRPPPLPTVDGKTGQLDVVSRLLKDRILLLGTEVNDEVALFRRKEICNRG